MSNGIDPQIVEAIASANLKVLGDAPAVALAVVYSALGHCVTLTMASATATQQGMANVGTAIADATAKAIYNSGNSAG